MSGNGLEENKDVARKFLRMLELGDPSLVDEIIASDYYNHDLADPNVGSEGMKAFVTMFKSAMPDARVDLEYQVAEGDRVVSRYTWHTSRRTVGCTGYWQVGKLDRHGYDEDCRR